MATKPTAKKSAPATKKPEPKKAAPVVKKPEPVKKAAAQPQKPTPKAAVKPQAEVKKPAPKATPKPEAKPAAKPDDKVQSSSKAQALLDGKDAAKTAGAVKRYAVQVGAFADDKKAHEVRTTLEKAGIKTYTQVVTTADGKRTRVRVGPWENKAEADKAAEKIKKLNLSASVLEL